MIPQVSTKTFEWKVKKRGLTESRPCNLDTDQTVGLVIPNKLYSWFGLIYCYPLPLLKTYDFFLTILFSSLCVVGFLS